jgi:hypothetical protein
MNGCLGCQMIKPLFTKGNKEAIAALFIRCPTRPMLRTITAMF